MDDIGSNNDFRRAEDAASAEDFVGTRTPEAWVLAAKEQVEILLIDHANCEKKAASTALSLMHRYPEQPALLNKMARLAREELRHFEQVIAIMQRRGIAYRKVSASRYASSLAASVRTEEPDRLVDSLVVGAVIEARSCERFLALAPHLDNELADFYLSLARSEARHYQDYLALAFSVSAQGVDERIAFFLQKDTDLITSGDSQLRFHSGVPI